MTDGRPPYPAALLFSEPPRSWPLAAELSARVDALAARLGLSIQKVGGDPAGGLSSAVGARTLVHVATRLSSCGPTEALPHTIRFFRIVIEPPDEPFAPAPHAMLAAPSGPGVLILPAGRTLLERLETAVETAGAFLDAALAGEDPARHPLLTLPTGVYEAHIKARSTLVPGLERRLLGRVWSRSPAGPEDEGRAPGSKTARPGSSAGSSSRSSEIARSPSGA